MINLRPYLIAICLSCICVQLKGQCKGFAKRNCLPALSPYISNGQLNAAQMSPGESAELKLNLNQGLSYRLVVCSDDYLADVSYSIQDDDGTVYYRDTIRNKQSSKDIKVTQSKALNLNIQTPEKENTTGITGSGCVSILVGFKD